MKRLTLFLCLLFIPWVVNSGTLTINQVTNGQTLGTTVFSAFSGIIPAGSGMLQVAHGPFEVFGSSTAYTTPGVSLLAWTIGNYIFATEPAAQVPFPLAGTMKQMTVVTPGSTLTASVVLRVRINGVNGNETVTIPASASAQTITDNVHTDNIPAGALVDFQIVSGADSNGSHFATFNALAYSFAASANNTASMTASNSYSGGAMCSTNGFANNYMGPGGIYSRGNQTESAAYYYMRTGGTWSNFCVYITTNDRSGGSDTFFVRKNGSNTALTMTVADGNTHLGLFCDNTHSFTSIAGDTITYVFTGDQQGGSNNVCMSFFTSAYTTTDGTMEFPAITNGHSFSPGDSNIIPIQGAAGYDSGESNDYAVPALQAGTLSNMCVTVAASGNLNQITTVNMRKNSANCGPVVTIPANQSTNITICDNTHSCSVLSTDILDYQETVPAGTGSLPWNSISAKFTHQ